MILSPQEVRRFYGIWFPLLHFVNQQRNLVAHFPAGPEDGAVSPTVAVKVRDALWADDSLREAFIAQNPAELAEADLALVASWSARVSGTFFVLRQLKKYAILIPEGRGPLAYAVLGLVSPIEEVLAIPPPSAVKATLLPFEGRIIYDSLLQGYNVYFGSGVRADLNETYKAAKERGTLLTSLGGNDPSHSPEAIRARNAKLLDQFQSHTARATMSQQTLLAHRATLERFVEEYLLVQQPPRGLITATAEDVLAYLAGAGGKVNVTSFKHFARFLRDTDRMEWREAEAMLRKLR